ncbi:MAG: insulinase family protein, partial [Planctomycetota bacterium]
MMRACATAMAVLLVVTSASAGARAALAQEPPTPLPRGPDARQLAPEVSRLANGLEIVLVPDHALPLISVQVWYRVGSADDEPNRPGLAHVARAHLEHRDDAPLRLLAAGVRLDSWTARDACWFASVMPATPEFLEFVLKIEAERMRPRAADAGAVDAALKAAAHDNSNPRDARGEALRRVLTALFAGHPYAEPPGCLAESLRSVTADELNAFRERWFVPGNATLLVVGDFQPPLAAELVRRHFAGLPWAEPPRRPEFP